MAGHTSTGSLRLQARILAALAMLVVVYAGFGWLLVINYGVPVPWVVLGAAAVLVGQWLPAERLALAVTKARLVDQQQAPRLHATLDRLCALSGQPKPWVALTRDRVANAFTVGRSRRHTTIIVTRGLLRLDPPELEAALAHELAHVEHRDVVVMTLASSFAVVLAWLLLGPLRAMAWYSDSDLASADMARAMAPYRDTEATAMVHAMGSYPSDTHPFLPGSFLLHRNGLGDLLDYLYTCLFLFLVFFAFLAWLFIAVFWGPVLAAGTLAMYLPLRALSRARELAADRDAALWLGRPALLAATLVKVQRQRDQIPRTDLRASGIAPLGLVAGRHELPGWLASHPPLDRRLAQLDQLTRLLR